MKSVVTMSVLLFGLLLLGGCNPVRPLPAGSDEPAATATATAEAQAADQDNSEAGSQGGAAANMAGVLANQLGIDSSEVTVTSSEAVAWPDACLGVTLEDEMCAQVITPGYKIVLSANGNSYTYHTDQSGSWYRLIEGPEVQIGERIADWRGTADNGSCLQASFGAEGVAFGPCGGVQGQGRYIDATRLAALQEWAAAYAPFQADTEWGTLDFAGTGTQQASTEQQAALARWAQTAAMEATAGQSIAGMSYEGPEELGSGDTSRCAILQIGGGESSVWACDGTVTTAPLGESLASTWADISGRFGSFVYETPSERLTFEGMGSLVDPVWQRALLAWARVTRAELASGKTSATARTALSWNLGTVPDAADVCAHLTLLDYGYAVAEQRGCTSGELVTSAEDWLSPEEMQQFDQWLYGYAPLYAGDNYLNGVGQEQMADSEAPAVQEWAAAVWTRLSGLPVAPVAADAGSAGSSGSSDAGAASCGEAPAGGQIYSSAEYGFCILVPEGYEMVESAPGVLNIVAGGDLMNHTSPRVGIEVTAAGDRTLAGITDQMMADYVPVGTDVTSRTLTIDGEEAVLLDNLPGQDLNRRVVVKHNNMVYSLMFMPLSPEAEPMYQAVLESLRFVK